MTWPRALLSGTGIVAIAFGLLVIVPNLLLTRLSSLHRSGRVTVTTVWFTVALTALLWILRRLQARRLI